MLKGCPDLVCDFFGQSWVEAFCQRSAGDSPTDRLGDAEAASLRRQLGNVYSTTFGFADPGFAGFASSEVRRIDLLERFVTPDLVTATRQTSSYPYHVAWENNSTSGTLPAYDAFESAATWNALRPDEYSWSVSGAFGRKPSTQLAGSLERRPADQWIGAEKMQVIIGDPGAGKSALLRYLALDLLREEPQWEPVAGHWSGFIPVWLPFHFLSQKIAGQTGEDATVGRAIRSWLEQNESGDIWPLVEQAIDERRLLLVVDGLDEWTDDDVGRYAVRAVERFAAVREVPVVASTRPYGLSKLALDGGWTYSRIAPLTYDQQRSLATRYFQAFAGGTSTTSSPDLITRRVDEFLEQVHRVPELRAFAGTPLFLIMLAVLHLSGSSSLPAQRLDVYERAVQRLVEEVPTERRTAADSTTPRDGLPNHELRAVLGKVSYANQLAGNVAALEEDALREDLVAALRDPALLAMDRSEATTTANRLLDVAEGELGLLVRTGPKQLGFIHRVIQEQLAAEYIAAKIEFAEVNALFAKYVGDPVWKETLLIAFRKISRPSEIRSLLETIKSETGETLSGLYAREFLAEVTFGAYGLPSDAVWANAQEIIEVVETHAYGPHRARLIDAVLAGVSRASTSDIVRGCLERWTLLADEPSRELVAQISLIPPHADLSDEICRLLVRALRNADPYSAFDNAASVANRCSAIATDEERQNIRDSLMDILEDPPSGLAQAASLTALALGWRDDPAVETVLDLARSHPDDQVRLVAVSDTLKILGDVFPAAAEVERGETRPVTDAEKRWLTERLWVQEMPEVHLGMLVAAISAAVRDDHSALAKLLALHDSDPDYLGTEVSRAVMLTAFGDHERVVNRVCEQIRGEGLRGLKLQIEIGDVDLLVKTYPVGSAHNQRVADAIESFLSGIDIAGRSRAFFNLAALDRGPVMRETLLKDLETSSTPHWAASALAAYFGEDQDVRAKLEAMIMGDPEQASRVAVVACQILGCERAIYRLVEILRSLAGSSASHRARFDIVASALIAALREEGAPDRAYQAGVVEEAMGLIPEPLHWIYGEPRLTLAAEFYPEKSAVAVLNEIAERDDPPLEAFLQAYRSHPDKLEPHLAKAANVLCSLPAYLRAHACRRLRERGMEPGLVTELTARWADERSDPNKSVASLVYHQALVRARQSGAVDAEAWDSALDHLGEQSSAYGPDYEARRRAAWIGMCVLEDWSPVLDRMETIGDPVTVTVQLHDTLNGPDRTLLQQVANSWEQLREAFGEELISRISGRREMRGQDFVWDALALVAEESPVLESELERELAQNPHLRRWPGSFLWNVRKHPGNSAVVLETLPHYLRDGDYTHDGTVYRWLIEPHRFGMQPEELLPALEETVRNNPQAPALELLAALFPDHTMVLEAWRTISGRHQVGSSSDPRVNPRTYFALAYAVAPSDGIVEQIGRHHERLCITAIPYFDRVFARHVSLRLRRDNVAARNVREAIMDPGAPDAPAAVLASLLGRAVGLDTELRTEIEHRINRQTGRGLATVVRDPHAGVSLPVRAILLGVAQGERDSGPL